MPLVRGHPLRGEGLVRGPILFPVFGQNRVSAASGQVHHKAALKVAGFGAKERCQKQKRGVRSEAETG